MSLFHPVCGDCGFRVVQGADSFCSLPKFKIDPNTESCSKHKFRESINFCEICGAALLEPGIVDLIDISFVIIALLNLVFVKLAAILKIVNLSKIHPLLKKLFKKKSVKVI